MRSIWNETDKQQLHFAISTVYLSLYENCLKNSQRVLQKSDKGSSRKDPQAYYSKLDPVFLPCHYSCPELELGSFQTCCFPPNCNKWMASLFMRICFSCRSPPQHAPSPCRPQGRRVIFTSAMSSKQRNTAHTQWSSNSGTYRSLHIQKLKTDHVFMQDSVGWMLYSEHTSYLSLGGYLSTFLCFIS